MPENLQRMILQPVGLEQNLEYKIKRHGDIFITGVCGAHFNINGNICAGLYLDRIVGKKEVRYRRPKLLNPFHTIMEIKDKRENEFYIDGCIMNKFSFESFVEEELNAKLLYKYERKIDFSDAEIFFLKAYEYYKKIADDSISK